MNRNEGHSLSKGKRVELMQPNKKYADLLVLIPAYNEEAGITAVIEGIRQHLGSVTILVVNDGSSDACAQLARAAGARVVDLPFNMGYGVALKTGYQFALRNGFKYLVQMDGDGQHDPACLKELLAPLLEGSAQLVLGSRYLGHTTYRVPLARRWGQALFSGILRMLTGAKITDPTSGMQAIHRDILELYSSDMFPADYPDADVLLLLHYSGFCLKEAPATFHADESGQSMHSGFGPVYYLYKVLLSILIVVLNRHKFKRK